MPRFSSIIRKFFLIPILVMALGFLIACQNPSTSNNYIVQEGKLDLRNWNPNVQGSVSLNGDWLFHQGIALAPDTVFKQPIQVPGSWNATMENPHSHPGLGTGTYQLTIALPNSISEPLALRFRDTSTAFKIFLNGQFLFENGRIGSSRHTMTPSYKHPIVLLDSSDKILDLKIEMSNFYHATGGLRKSVDIATFQQAMNSQRIQVALDWMLFGAVFLMGLYHLAIFSVRTKDLSSLFFGLFCINVSLRSFFTGSVIAYETFDDIYWTLIHRIDISTYTFSIPLFILFLSRIFEKDMHRWIPNTLLGVSGVFWLTVLVLPSEIYMQIINYYHVITGIMITYLLYMIFKTISRKREGSHLFLIGCTALFATTINDMLNQALIINTMYLANWGLLVFLFTQASLLSVRHSNAYRRLEELQSYLEDKVLLRTHDLEKAKVEAERANELKDKFLSLLSHDLRAPISTVIGLLDYIGSDYHRLDDTTKIKLIKQARITSKESLNMIGLLLNLNRLQSGALHLQLEDIIPATIVEQIINKFWIQIQKKNVKITNAIPKTEKIFGDTALVTEVMHNLISNAIKYSHPAGEVRVSLDNTHPGIVYLTVEDKGIGIPEKNLSRIFIPDAKFSTPGTMGEDGTGMSLPLIQNIIRAWNGELTIQSEENNGTKVRFSIPQPF